jgi:ABC-type multidrug transport system fused ATPase/permease subunit
LAYAVSYYQGEMFQLFEERSQARTARMTSKVQDVFSKYPTVLIYNTKNTEKKLMWQLVRHNYKVLRSKAIFSGVIVCISEFLSWCTVLLGVFLGVSLLNSFATNASGTDDKVGLFTTFALFSMNVIRAMIQILKTLPRIGETLGGVSEVLRMIDREPRPPEGNGSDDNDRPRDDDNSKKNKKKLAMINAPRSRSVSLLSQQHLPNIRCTTGEIEFRNVVFSYPTAPDRIALNGVSLKVQRNSKVALIGDSGAGKSTILQMIARFYDPTSGAVLLDGQDMREYNTPSIRSHMAIVSQESDIFSLSIFENLIYGRNIEEEQGGLDIVDEALDALRTGQRLSARAQKLVDDALDAAERAHALDFVQGRLTEVLGEGGKGLSGGQKQRLAIARALFKNPKILLLDEVTSALDPISEAAVQKAIDTLTQNRTVFIVAHRLHTIQNADKIVVLSGGKIVAEGNHEELMQSSQKYRDLVQAAVQSGGNVAAVKKAASPSTVADEVPQEMVQLFRRIKHEFAPFEGLREEFFPRIHQICPELSPKPQVMQSDDSSTIELSGVMDRDLDAEDETEAPVRPSVHPRFRRPEFGSVRDYYELIDEDTDDESSSSRIN